MKYVFGPVASRRLGRSLGVDPLPAKTCNWNCVYCQLGRTPRLKSEREDFAPLDDILREVDQALDQELKLGMDWLTVVGAGEPALYRRLPDLIDGLLDRTSIPIALITNGSLLDLPDVSRAAARCQAVMPTLDCASDEGYRRLNRPHPAFTLERHVRGLRAFRQVYWGKIWLEVMLVRGHNDEEGNLEALLSLIEQIEPDEIHLNQPMRPPAEPWVRPASRARMERARQLFGPAAQLVPPKPIQYGGTLELELGRAILNVVTRHPMTLDEITDCLAYWPHSEVEGCLMRMWRQGDVQSVRRYRQCFWAAGAARYGRGSNPVPAPPMEAA
jgi:wyosine [tRNA(Phe)-imidazoG37] synthetase (radical SAM superfamily)